MLVATREGDPPTATDLDDDKEGIRHMVSIRDSCGSDLDSGSNVELAQDFLVMWSH